MEIYITDHMEIIPTIQRFLPYIKVIEPEDLREEVMKNVREYMS
jgi:predicted DNA-binding transcriptional regulator YafY